MPPFFIHELHDVLQHRLHGLLGLLFYLIFLCQCVIQTF
jgi:hypothetical protein